MSFLVVDDFCAEIDKVRESVFAAGFDTWNPNKGEVGSSIYEGMGFWGDHALMLRSLMKAVGGIVIPNTLYFRATNSMTEQAYIHSDRQTGNHTCVCYMTDHDENYGTAFYRHKKTGWLEMPSFEQMRELGVMEAMAEDMTSRDPDKWEKVDFVKGRKNRALIFSAPLFHSRVPVHGFGTDAETARLVWATHFYKLDNAGNLV